LFIQENPGKGNSTPTTGTSDAQRVVLKLPVPSTKHAQLINYRFSMSYQVFRALAEKEQHNYGARTGVECIIMVQKKKAGCPDGVPGKPD
jgi:hypothetical protein